MSPQQIMLLRRHASSAAALLERKETEKPVAKSIRNDGAGQHSVKKRPPPARPPLPARLRSISHQPLPGQLSEFQGALMRNVKTDRSRSQNDNDPHQVYVSSTSRICLANSLEGLVEPVAPKLDGCRPPAPLPSSGGRNNIQAMRNVTVEDTIEMQSVACWLEGLSLFFFSSRTCGHHLSQFCGESDGDDLVDDHHYEALYEVINPRLQSSGAAASVTLLDHNDDSFDDSFDSDDAFEEVVVRGLDATSDTSRERPGSRSGSERSKESEDPSLRSGQVKIGRFADLAGEQMRRLRRNWTTTKTDIGKSITRIKKKSTASVADLSEVFKASASRREVSPDKGNNGAANKEPIYSPSPPTSPAHPEVRPNSGDQKKKGTWAMRQIRRRMTIVSPTYGATGNKEKASTFYLTLTIEQPTTPVKANDKSLSETSSPEPQSTPSPVPPLISPQSSDSSKVPARPKRISSACSLGPQYQSTVRPKTAPPAPPVKSPRSS
ncbi:putative Guanine nucleotide exchange factor [Daphnia magna]|uniref:Putative Guanine nucleotide exchange factor n=1 Tax=Daphnia magna TaxID=35525 RepID=A0A162CEX2_9CRUS|nr:putative Guanine nucleotide exchange factor [Daphnia magna]